MLRRDDGPRLDRGWVQGAVGRRRRDWVDVVEDAAVWLCRAGLLVGSLAAGWLFAAHVDPDGWLVRATVGWLIGRGGAC